MSRTFGIVTENEIVEELDETLKEYEDGKAIYTKQAYAAKSRGRQYATDRTGIQIVALRARLSPPQELRSDWPWHSVQSTSLKASLMFRSGRRLEAGTYLGEGYAARLAIESKQTGWVQLSTGSSNDGQPSRLKAIQISSEYGTPVPYRNPGCSTSDRFRESGLPSIELRTAGNDSLTTVKFSLRDLAT